MIKRSMLALLVLIILLAMLLGACAGNSPDQPMHVQLVEDEFSAASNVACYRPAGGAEFVCSSGGAFTAEDGATINLESGATLAIAGDGTITYNSLPISMTAPITISGVLTNVQLIYYAVP